MVKEKKVKNPINVKRGRAAKAKGARGERWFANYLTDWGFPARRGQQFKGTKDSPDISCETLEDLGFHLESKFTQTISMYPTLEKGLEDSGGVAPLVLYKKDNKPPITFMYLQDFMKLLVLLLDNNRKLKDDNDKQELIN